MSMGFLNPGDKPLVWRGPMLHSVIQQFLRGVDWGELDYLVIDLPPGTGDVQLSLIQTAPLTGAVVVTTPSDVSLEDARKAVNMFEQVRVPILGIVENMSYLICPHCNERIDVFSHGGGNRTAESMNVPFLGELPLASRRPHRRRFRQPHRPRRRQHSNSRFFLLSRHSRRPTRHRTPRPQRPNRSHRRLTLLNSRKTKQAFTGARLVGGSVL